MDREIQAILEDVKKSAKERSQKSSEESSREKQTMTMTDCGMVCPKCKGTGWFFVDDNTVKECDCGLLERERMASKLQFASIPETYKNVSLKDLKTSLYNKRESKDVFNAIAHLVKWYLEHLDENIENGKGLYFWSNTKGSGKTMTATALANELINKHRKYVKYATSLDILDEIRSTYGNRDSEASC